jgi:hypothetical protein
VRCSKQARCQRSTIQGVRFGETSMGAESPRTDRSVAAERRRRSSFARALRASSEDSLGFAGMTRGRHEPSATNYRSLTARQNSHHLTWSPART